MGVHGLWKLLEPAGKPVPVETLENKVLAVDVSIWLHQLVKGFQDSTGSSLPNAHLLGLYHRICKLLFFKIKPVFVFDGGVPVLKRRTMTARQNQKSKAELASERVREQLLKNILKQKAVGQVLEEIRGEKTSPQKKPDMFELPPIAEDKNEDSELEESSSSSEETGKNMHYRDLHSIDVNSREFKAMPADIRHDILTELKETRKQNSWGKLHEMPEELSDFSSYQMKRLLTRRSVQVSLEEAEKEMGGRTLSLFDVETLLKDGGVEISEDIGKRIASDSSTRYLYINNIGGNTINASEATQTRNAKKRPADDMDSSDSEIDHGDLKTIEELYVDSDDKSDTSQDINTAQQCIDDNDDLSQEQILAVIKEQNKPLKPQFINLDAPSTSKQSQLYEDLLDKNKNNKADTEIEDFEEESAVNSRRKSKNVEVPYRLEPVLANLHINTEQSSGKGELNQNRKNLEQSSLSNEYKIELSSKSSFHKEDIVGNKVKSNIPIKKVRTDILKFLDAQLKELSNQVVNIELNSVEEMKIERDTSIEANRSSVPEVTTVKSENGCSEILFNTISEKEHIGNITSCNSVSESVNHTSTEDLSTENISETHPVSVQPDNACVDANNEVDLKEDIGTSSDSDSEFIDVPSPSDSVTNETTEKNKNFPCLQVQIEPKDMCEDDMFADVFESNGNNNDSCNSISSNAEEEDTDSASSLSNNKDVNINSFNSIVDSEMSVDDSRQEESVIVQAPYFVESQKIENSEVNQSQQEDVNKPKLSSKELLKLQNYLESQEEQLLAERGKEERVAATITEQMYVEAQELLQLFGVPYVVAPMEAEAQCAFLDSIGLTQGTITDDSDIWLFGGCKVYKNFFSQNKYVLQFQSEDIQHFFKLARAQLVLLALLVGSDYTVGVQGVGPVTALEILALFPPPLNADGTDIPVLLTSLEKFKQWLKSSPATSLGKKLKDVQLQPGFPSPDVVKAYLNPIVDESTETFSWGTPDLDALREFAERKFGWNKTRSDSVLLPVMKKLAEKSNQRTINSYFQAVPNIPARREQMSVRVQRAVQRIGGDSEGIEPAISRRNTTRGSTRARGRGRSRGRGRTNEEETVRSRFRERSEYEPPLEPLVDPLTYDDGIIPQREQDRLNSLKRKMNAIEVMKGSKRGRGGKKRRNIRVEKKEAKLSESSSDDEKVL